MNYKSADLLNAIASCSPDGYVACDEFGKVTFINEAIERITGWGSQELIGQEVAKIYTLPESLSIKVTSGDACTKPQAAILFRRDGKKITLSARQIEIKNVNRDKIKNGISTLPI